MPRKARIAPDFLPFSGSSPFRSAARFRGRQEPQATRARSFSFSWSFGPCWPVTGAGWRWFSCSWVFRPCSGSFRSTGRRSSSISSFRDQPLPAKLPRWVHLPTGRRELLTVVALGMVAMAVASKFAGLWSRWQTTRMTKRVQVSVRKRVFDHAVRLPLHRVYELKSGGVASILREDARGVSDLIFSMLYNPWRAIVQLLGSLVILAFVDWRLLLGSLALLPTVWLTHRTWIARIRPIFRDIGSTRQLIDSHAT